MTSTVVPPPQTPMAMTSPPPRTCCCELDTAGRIVWASPELKEQVSGPFSCGAPLADCLGLPLDSAIHHAIAGLSKGTTPPPLPLACPGPDAVIRDWQIEWIPRMLPGKSPMGSMVLFRSVPPQAQVTTRVEALLQAIGFASENLIKSPLAGPKTIQETLQHFGNAAGVHQIALYEIQHAPPTVSGMVQRYAWSPAAPSAPSAPSSRHAIPLAESFYKRLATGRPYQNHTTAISPKEALSLTDLAVASFLLLPVFCDTGLWGVLAIGDTNPERFWQGEETDAFAAAARILASLLDRKKSLETHAAGKQSANAISDHASALFFILNPDLNVSYVSPSWENRFGQNTQTTLHHPFTRLIHPDDHPLWHAAMDHLHRQEENIPPPEFRLKGKADTWHWILAEISLLRAPDGTTASVLIVATDMTTQKQTVQHLKSSRDRFRDQYHSLRYITDIIPDLIWTKDLDDRYVYVNQSLCDRLLQCPCPEAAIGKTDLFFARTERQKGYHHTFGEICIDSDHQVRTSEKPGRFEEFGLVRGQMLVLDVHKAPLYDAEGRLIGTVGCARDVTEEKKIAADLKESESRFAAFMDRLPGCAFLKDASGKYVFINEFMRKRYHVGNWQEKDPSELFSDHRASRFIMEDLKSIREGELESIDTITDDSGQSHVYRKLKFPIPRQGKETLIGGIAIDITRQIQAEQDLLAAKSDLEHLVAERTADLKAANQELRATIRRLENTRDEMQRRENAYRKLVATSPELLFQATPDGRLTTLTTAWEEHTGHPIHTLVGRRITDLMEEASASRFHRHLLHITASPDSPTAFLTKLLSAKGIPVEARIRLQVLKDAEGRVEALVGAIQPMPAPRKEAPLSSVPANR